ncbi:hypothetical protein L3X38_021177 [Prunus dulcis]|uniref:Uncharacterized protein n=1 Tax=Prunus dulcis TaxID=3755 RepID=A0AAD4VW26_PRUDU|nr:hypothetical protein L3X38_021177 [Prunus dulcis]
MCNTYTRQWDALPPAPRCHEEVRVGFICEPYYYNNDKNQQCDRKEEQVEEESEIRVNVQGLRTMECFTGEALVRALLLVWIPTKSRINIVFVTLRISLQSTDERTSGPCLGVKDDHQMDMDVYRDVDMDVVAGNNGKWFDPNNEDILYLEIAQHIVMCNIREERLTEVSKTPYSYFEIHSAKPVFPFVFPWWPTPILTRHKSASSSSNSHLHRVTSTTRTRRAIKRMLQKRKEKPASACACRRAIAKKKRTIIYHNHYFLT